MTNEKTPKQEIVEILREGRATPHLIKEHTSINAQQTVDYHLRNLRAENRVKKVSRGLYELVDDDSDETDGQDVFDRLVAALEEQDSVTINEDEFEFPEGGDRSE